MFLLVTIVCFSQASPHHQMFTFFQVMDMLVLIVMFLRYCFGLSAGIATGFSEAINSESTLTALIQTV